MPVYGIVDDVGLASDDPLDKWGLTFVPHLVPFLIPLELFGTLGPKSFRVSDRALVERLVFLYVGLFNHLR
jgi:hypothetical protein